MQLESVNCNQCGAPLEVPESANYVTCNHCQAQLAIKRTASATFTEKLDQLDQKTDQMLQHLKRLAYENRLAAIDRSWEREKKNYMIRGKHGQLREPSEAGALLGTVILCVMGVFAMTVGFGNGSPFGLIGLVFLAIAAISGMYTWQKAKDYRAARRRYRLRRSSVTLDSALEESGGQPPAQFENVSTPGEFLRDLGQD